MKDIENNLDCRIDKITTDIKRIESKQDELIKYTIQQR